ncbi:MAG TPA: ABC transporter ATP-binding protein [Caldisericia bacterium]|nr:ABC transporter ATP-binding protein [Caldisericia bacterium]HQL65978.1 ABC transporter ATP-binding protein [Caldisericia bacterium]HQN49074.1 ABC transporter ATP-binding protein [Caldisericia bacterium]HQO99654.1 ABC transporter ATP-binding protein [Caldisericia bacterium]
MKKIIIKDLNFGYYDTEIFRNFSLEIDEGEILTILGPNGSGKTTLLKLIQKIILPKSGDIIISGKNINNLTNKALSKSTSFVPQIHNQTFPYRVIDFVLMGRNPYINDYSIPKEEDIEIANKVLEEMGLYYLKDRPYTDISGGELRLVLIARGIVQNTEILLLDEPTAFLDFKNQLIVLETIKELKEKKKLTVIMTLHNPNEAYKYSDKILLIKKGEVISYGKPIDVINDENLKKVYSVDVEIVRYNGETIIYAKK